MKIKCDYCGSYIDDTEEKCPNCGATNSHLQRKAVGTPTTIEELDRWYKEHNLPPEDVTRFFIGKNYTGDRAFGIYKDEQSGNFIVYKNKADGTRAIRYEGKDEAYAVNELYMKLKEEIANQKNNNNKTKKAPTKNSGDWKIVLGFILFIFLFIVNPLFAFWAFLGVALFCVRSSNKKKGSIPKKFFILGVTLFIYVIITLTILIFFGYNMSKKGYYYYDDTYYYYQSGTWYEYDDYTGWYETSAPDELEENYSDYYESGSYDSDYDIEDFKDSDYYESWYSSSSSDSDWDSGSSWDSSDSWDSGSTDWDSDW